MKTVPSRWLEARSSQVEDVIRIQALFRGRRVRRRLQWAGPGVLQRSRCVNEEDVVTMDDIRRIPPEEYFAWEEGGKVWGFQVPTILQIARGNLHPVNPYTKAEIPMEARMRMRRIFYDRVRRRLPLSHTPSLPQESLEVQQTVLCQNLEEQGFDGYHPEHWNSLSHAGTLYFLERLSHLLRGWSLEPPHRAWREAYAGWVRTTRMTCVDKTTYQLRWAAARICNVMFAREIQSYEIAFHIISAYTQVL